MSLLFNLTWIIKSITSVSGVWDSFSLRYSNGAILSTTPFYQESYFIVSLVSLVVVGMIALFILRNNFSIKRFEAYSEYKTHLAKLRFLSILFLIGLPAIEWSQQSFIEGHTSRWGLILIEMTIILVFFASTLIKSINSIFINVFSVVGSSAVICLLLYRTFLDNFGTVYMAEVIVSMAYTVIIFNNLKHQVYQLILVNVYFTVLFLTTQNENQVVLIFVSAFIAIQVFAVLFHLFQIHKLDRISFSERILNSYDRLVIVYNIRGEVVYVNPFLKKFVGKRDEELLGDAWYEVRHCSEERTQQIKLSIRQQILEQLTIDELNEEIYSEPNEKIRTVNWTFQVLDGSYLMSIGSDITELLEQRKEIEELSSVTQSVNNGVVITDTKGVIQWVNDSFCSMTGYTSTDFVGKKPTQVFRIPEFFQDEFNVLIKEGPIFHDPLTVAHYDKSGDVIWLMINTTPIYNENGDLEKIIEVVTDITEQKEKDIEFEKLSLVAQHTQNPILITNASYQINWINGGFTRQLGYTLEDIEDREPGDLLFKSSTESTDYAHFVSQVEAGKMAKGDFVLYKKDGSPVWMNVTVDPILNNAGVITSFICLMQNIQEIKDAQAIIEEKNKDITDSISYAQRIQGALLPNLKLVKQNLPKHFVFYRPKDIVSGDFYYIEMYRNKVYIGIADCTGHGVPGAMMTSIGAAALNNAILDRKLSDPAAILNHVDGYLKASLSTSTEGLRDGMDIGLIVLNIADREIEYSGAKRPLIVVDKNGEMTTIPGIKRSIGQFIMGDDFKFRTTAIPVEEGTSIYCFSDGIPDQFGGEKGKKIYQSNLIDFLVENSHLPMKEQHQALNNYVDEWQRDFAQTDDMVLFGAKVTTRYFDKLSTILASNG